MASKAVNTMLAIKVNGTAAKITRVPIPEPPPTYLLARVESVALNPTDWKHIANSRAGPNCTSGCDLAGTVVSLPKDATKAFAVGDRIAATTHGSNFSNREDGAFAEYALVKADLAMKLPASLPFDKAATLPLGLSTVGQGLFQKGLKMRLPTEAPAQQEPVLIYGGSSATGSLSIQFANLAGYKVLTTCSSKHEAFVKSLGASEVYDYRETDVAARIRKDTANQLKLVWDCIGSPETAATCAAALSSDDAGCRYASTNPGVSELPGRPGVPAMGVFMYTIFNRTFEKMGKPYPASEEDFEFARLFFSLSEKLLHENKLLCHPDSVGAGGLEGVLQGMKDMKDGKVSGQKLVYRVAETPPDSTAGLEF